MIQEEYNYLEATKDYALEEFFIEGYGAGTMYVRDSSQNKRLSSIIESIDNFLMIEGAEIDISEKLLADVNLMQSVKKARQEMRRGVAYFSHKDVFGR